MILITIAQKMTDFKTFVANALKQENSKVDPELAMKFIDYLDTKEQFPVPIEHLVDLEVYVRKDPAKRALQNGDFVKDRDFSTVEWKSTGGRPAKQIMLSAECFKSLCMLAQNSKGKQVRQYYLTIERLWKRYIEQEFASLKEEKAKIESTLEEKEDEYKKLQKKHKMLVRNRTRHKFKQGPCLYLWHNKCGEHKIGIAGTGKNDINSRISIERVSCPDLVLDMILYTNENERIESDTKFRFRKHRLGTSNEMFKAEISAEQITDHIMDFVKVREIAFTKETKLDQYNIDIDNPKDQHPEETLPESPIAADDSSKDESHESSLADETKPLRVKKHTLEDYITLGKSKGLELVEGQTIQKNNKPMMWKCSIGHEYKVSFQILKGFAEDVACITCKGKQDKILSDYVDLAANKKGYFTGKTVPSKTTEKVNGWKCGVCEHVWAASFFSVKSGHWCPNCAKNKRYGIEEYIEAGNKWEMEFMESDAPKSVKTKANWKCKKHGIVCETDLVLLRRRKAPPCTECRKG